MFILCSRAFATALSEEVVKPLKQLVESQHRIRKSVETAVDKTGIVLKIQSLRRSRFISAAADLIQIFLFNKKLKSILRCVLNDVKATVDVFYYSTSRMFPEYVG